jgi:hypothetical protein
MRHRYHHLACPIDWEHRRVAKLLCRRLFVRDGGPSLPDASVTFVIQDGTQGSDSDVSGKTEGASFRLDDRVTHLTGISQVGAV